MEAGEGKKGEMLCGLAEGGPAGGSRGGAPKAGVPKGGATKGGAPKGGEPKISLFFFPLPPQFPFFLPLLGVVSWNFGGVIEGRVLLYFDVAASASLCCFSCFVCCYFLPTLGACDFPQCQEQLNNW